MDKRLTAWLKRKFGTGQVEGGTRLGDEMIPENPSGELDWVLGKQVRREDDVKHVVGASNDQEAKHNGNGDGTDGGDGKRGACGPNCGR